MNTIELTITNVHERNFAFGVSDIGEQCFIPPHVLDGSGATRGSTVTAQVVTNPNEKQRENTRWCAIMLTLHTEKDDVQPEPKERTRSMQELDEEVLDYIHYETYVSSGDIASELGVDTTTAGNSAYRLFNAGKIAKADVYAKVGQARPSFILWAKNAQTFVEADHG